MVKLNSEFVLSTLDLIKFRYPDKNAYHKTSKGFRIETSSLILNCHKFQNFLIDLDNFINKVVENESLKENYLQFYSIYLEDPEIYEFINTFTEICASSELKTGKESEQKNFEEFHQLTKRLWNKL